ncbi:uncharacterized protein LOC141768409 [Sebastes fasciatus]|uniref:uncharacterized protein LOC141768409 n=1 Tax=Sebastes fasciatus TaxID=394691 RepID=UPI003D9E7BD5
MSSVESLREFVNERLTAAAEEIFRVLEKTIVEQEEEIDRQRRLLDIVLKPEIKLHRRELPQQHVCKEEEVPVDQQLCIQERNSSLDQEDPDPPQIKEEQEELCTSQEGEQLVLKQETDSFMLTPTHEEGDNSEVQTLYLNAAEKESVVNMPVITSVVSVPNSDHQLFSHISHEAESQDQRGGEHGDSGSTRDAEPKSQKRHCKSRSHSNNVNNSNLLEIHRITNTGKQSFSCDTCGKDFKYNFKLKIHMRTHTGEKPYVCKTCEKRFSHITSLKTHMGTHTGEKPFTCKTRGKDFRLNGDLTVHMRTHTGETPYSCKTCGKRFSQASTLKTHLKTHTGKKPFTCKTCGKDFGHSNSLMVHMRTHTGEKPFTCKTCGKDFKYNFKLKIHMRTHTGETPYSCKTCGKRFSQASTLKTHLKTHTGVQTQRGRGPLRECRTCY